MNILCQDTYTQYLYSDAMNKIDRKYNIDNIFIVGLGKKKFNKQSLDKKIKYWFQYYDVYYAYYGNCPYYKKMTPLDADILNAMALYEPEAIKMSERVSMATDSAEKRFMNYHSYLRYWNTFLTQAKIDVCLWNERPHDIYDYVIYRLCQLKGIKFIIQELLPMQSCCGVFYQDDYEVIDEFIVSKVENSDVTEVRLSKHMKLEYDVMVGAVDSVAPVIAGTRAERFVDALRMFRNLARYDFQLMPKKMAHLVSEFLRIKNMMSGYERLAIDPDYSKPYIFFALHYQPEMTTSPTGGWFVHQYLAVEMLSYYVPKGVMIYVKEHPVLLQSYSTTIRVEHYYRMDKLPNVKLIKMHNSGEELAMNAKAVATISGSIGYWSMYKHKTHIMFGNLFMKYAPNTFNVRTNKDCKRAMKAIFEDGFSVEDKDVKRFLDVIDDVSVLLPSPPFIENRTNYSKKNKVDVANAIMKLIEK